MQCCTCDIEWMTDPTHECAHRHYMQDHVRVQPLNAIPVGCHGNLCQGQSVCSHKVLRLRRVVGGPGKHWTLH